MNGARLSGVVVATVLPFDETGAIDWPGYERVLQYCAMPSGISAVFVNGHAGEAASLSPSERGSVIEFTRRVVGARMPILAGVLAQSTAEAIEQARQARQAGADIAVLFPLPVMQGAPTMPAAAPVAFVESVAQAVDMTLSVFQYPLASGFGYNTETLVAIAQIPAVKLIKEGSGDPAVYDDNVRRIRAAAPDVSIMATNSGWLMAQAAIGGDGILSGLASLTPHWLVDVWRAAQDGDLNAMRVANDKLYPVVRRVYGAPRLDIHTRIKVALRHMGVIRHAAVRAPLLPVSEAQAEAIRKTIDESGLAARLAG